MARRPANSKKIACKICGTKFVPEDGQLRAYWAVNWCTRDEGLLCPPCHQAAKKLHAVSKTPLPLGVCPFASDIAEKSANVTKKDWERMCSSESWRTWVTDNHPEWL
jgi:hypothetical protein